MKTDIKSHVGLRYVMLAGIFLFDPMIGFVDVLPDVVGYLLLCMGLSKLSDLNDTISESAQRFRTMVWVGFGQLVAAYLVHVVMGQSAEQMNRYEQPVAILLCSFVLLVLRWYFLIPAYRGLFKGLGQLAERHDARALCEEKKNQTRSERMSVVTTAWIIVSACLSVLPETSILTSFEHDAESEIFTFDWYRFIALFRGACGVLLTILAIVWLVKYIRYAATALRDREWLETLRARYINEVLPQTGMLTLRRLSLAFLLIKVGAIFTVSFRLNHFSVLPALGFSVLILLAISRIDTPAEEKRGCRITCITLAVFSAIHLFLNVTYLMQFQPEASLYQADAYWHFLITRVAGALEAIITLVAVGAMLRVLKSMIREHIEIDYGSNAVTVSARATERLHGELEKRLKIIFVIFFLAALVNAADALLQLTVPWLWLIALVLSVAGICLLSSFLHEIFIHLKNRYQQKV